jgi:phosphoribosyl 1,2-cyclic phosphodiesterase
MRFSVLSSGSKANCTYIDAGEARILIDCGLSASRAAERLESLGVPPDSITAILVTHEHSDHLLGVPVFSRRHKVPVFANRRTAAFLKPCYGIEHFSTGEPFSLGEVRINPFSIVHDAVDPVGFVVTARGLKFAQATDLGRVTPLVRDALALAQAIVIESNHDQEMLRYCSYPWELKQRIASSHGHLSNRCAATLLGELRHPELLHVVLGHLSEESNSPELALETSRQFLLGHAGAEPYGDDEPSFPSFRCAGPGAPTPLLALEPHRA